MTARTARRFPEGFVWGVATAAYQIEGGAAEDGRGESIWDRFSHTPGTILDGQTGDVACDHYHRWREDVALMRSLHVRAYRFSIAWTRVLGPDGSVNPAGLTFYRRLIDHLLGAGITPWVTLYHWDLPQALEDRGGWPERSTAHAFAAYADVVTRALGDRVRHWITLNEPWCSAFLGYHQGVHAPGRTDLRAALQAAHTLLLAHGLAVPAIRANCPQARVGIALNLPQPYPASPDPRDLAAARRYDGYANRWLLDPLYGRGYPEDLLAAYGRLAPEVHPADLETIAAPTDFLGVNHYYPVWVRDDPAAALLQLGEAPRPDLPRTSTGWPVHGPGLLDLLRRLHADYPVRAIVVAENGAAFADTLGPDGRVHDPLRTAYLAAYLGAVHRAIQDRVPVQGYFVWTLMDNFEWACGHTQRFGLVYTDFASQRRIAKDSGRWYRRVIDRNGLPAGDPR